MKTWQRNLYILAFVQLVSAVGFSSIFPFLPLYIEDLGSSTGLSIEFMSGMVFSAQAFTMMIASPIWGALADRHGRKMMVLRATLGGAVIILAMGFVRNAEQLVLLRAVQGALTGILGALTALVAASVPRERTGYALGILQVGLWGGVSLGPLIGGVVADSLGFQAAFIATAVLLFFAGLLVWFGVEEEFKPAPRKSVNGHTIGFFEAWRHVLNAQGVRTTYMTRFLSRLGRTMIFPFSPLFIQQLMGSADRAATLTGVALAAAAAAGTVAAIYLGRLGDRVGHRRVLIAAAVGAGIFYVPISAVGNVWQFIALLTITGAAAGGIMPAISALLAAYTEPGEEGAVYGLESSIMSAARTVSPMIGAMLVAWFGLRSVYAATGIVFLGMALIAWHWLPVAPVHTSDTTDAQDSAERATPTPAR